MAWSAKQNSVKNFPRGPKCRSKRLRRSVAEVSPPTWTCLSAWMHSVGEGLAKANEADWTKPKHAKTKRKAVQKTCLEPFIDPKQVWDILILKMSV